MEISREILTRVTILDISVILMYIIGIVALAQNFKKVSIRFVRFFVLIGITHLFFTFVYYFYTLDNVADSIGYYRRVLYLFDNWGTTFGQGVNFIYFTLYPLVKIFGITYFGSFFFYSFIGLLGYYYLVKVLMDITKKEWTNWFYLLLLPNIHFWSVATGKDSLIFFAISLLFYTYYFNKSWHRYILPLLLIAFIRLHILFFLLISFGMMQLVLNKKIKAAYKFFIFIFLGASFYLLFPFLMQRIGFVDTESIISQLEELESTRAHGGTSLDMSGENLFVKWISYLFRPFFFDARNILSVIISMENIVWIAVFFIIFKNIKKNIVASYRNVFWFCFFSIFMLTIPAAFLLYNLGIAVRQKTMIVPFLFILLFLTIYKSITSK